MGERRKGRKEGREGRKKEGKKKKQCDFGAGQQCPLKPSL
jgi:hypothetical protein